MLGDQTPTGQVRERRGRWRGLSVLHVCVWGGRLKINEVELSIKCSSLLSIKALFYFITVRLVWWKSFSQTHFGKAEVRELPGWCRVKQDEAWGVRYKWDAMNHCNKRKVYVILDTGICNSLGFRELTPLNWTGVISVSQRGFCCWEETFLLHSPRKDCRAGSPLEEG